MDTNEISLNDWITHRMLRGNYLFTKDDVTHSFPLKNQNYLRTNISRLTKKGVIISPWRNFYVAVPEEYRLKGVVPPLFYIDSMMRFFGMPYYVALLSAASLYGAAHQVPQFFMVMTNDDIRSIDRKGIRIMKNRRLLRTDSSSWKYGTESLKTTPVFLFGRTRSICSCQRSMKLRCFL